MLSRVIQIDIYGGQRQVGSTMVSNPGVKLEIERKEKKEITSEAYEASLTQELSIIWFH